MPNHKMLEAMAEDRRQMRPAAERVYAEYRHQVPRLIRQLAGPTQADHDDALDLLHQMGDLIVSELLAALDDPGLDEVAVDGVVSLLGMTGDDRAREPVWEFFQAHQDDVERASTAALSLAYLADERVLPFVRQALDAEDEDVVSNAVVSLFVVGTLDDIPRLRALHREHLTSQEIRAGIANAVLTIVGEADQRTFNRTLDDIQAHFADRHLWDDIWATLENEFGTKDVPWQ
jgi:HEAT repeat protein